MIRVRTLFVTVLPSMIAGGFLFASAFGHADTGRDSALGFWPAASDTATGRVLVAQVDPWDNRRSRRPAAPPTPPTPPMPPAPPSPMSPMSPPTPPTPPTHRGRHGNGVSVSVHDGKIEIDGIADLIQGQLEGVADMLDNLPDVPPDVRDRVKERVRAVRSKVTARLAKLKSMDLDKIGPEMERMGDEIEKEMEGLDKDLEKLGAKFGKQFSRQFGKKFGKDLARSLDTSQLGNNIDDDRDGDDDDDDKDAVVMPPNVPSDLDPQGLPPIGDLKNLTLDAGQKAELAKLRAEADRQVATAKRSLDEMSDRLHDALGNGGASEADIARQIDSISAQEAIIRKARILSWVKARNVLHQDQRKLVEAAVKRGP